MEHFWVVGCPKHGGLQTRCWCGWKGGRETSAPSASTSPAPAAMRQFETGATRNLEDGKYDFEGFLSPAVLERFAEYMHKHRVQADGELRPADNWQLGIPKDAYMKSGWRHFHHWWKLHRAGVTGEEIEDAICAHMFNAMGYLFELLRSRETQTD